MVRQEPELAKTTSPLSGTPLGAACPGLPVVLHPLLGAPQELGEGHLVEAEVVHGG